MTPSISPIVPTRPVIAAWQRLTGLVRKETIQIVRDPSSILVAFVMPVLLLLLFGYGVSLDARNVRLALVMESPTREAFNLAGSFVSSPYFKTTIMTDAREAEAALVRGDAQAILVLRADFARNLRSPDGATIQLTVNGTDSNSARLISGYVDGTFRTWLRIASAAQRIPISSPVTVEQRVWFNPGVRSQDFLVPGLIAINMTLIGALLTALVIAREWERGTMEALIVTPVRAHEIVLGKLIPYFALGMGGMALSAVVAVWLFGVPFRGSLLALIGISSLFMLTMLGIGLLISTLSRSQFVAAQLALVGTFLPAFMLSGFQFDIASMPEIVRWITHLVPARYFVSSLQTLFLAGTVPSVLLPDALALAGMAVFFIGLTLRKTRKLLE